MPHGCAHHVFTMYVAAKSNEKRSNKPKKPNRTGPLKSFLLLALALTPAGTDNAAGGQQKQKTSSRRPNHTIDQI
jgi:hypothetical protein